MSSVTFPLTKVLNDVALGENEQSNENDAQLSDDPGEQLESGRALHKRNSENKGTSIFYILPVTACIIDISYSFIRTTTTIIL